MSTLNVNQINNAAGTGQPNIDGLAKAWVNFNGTGTVAIRASYNVSSITDNGVGNYTVNLSTAMPDANYSGFVSGNTTGGGDQNAFGRLANMTSSNFQLLVGYTVGYYDNNAVGVAIFR